MPYKTLPPLLLFLLTTLIIRGSDTLLNTRGLPIEAFSYKTASGIFLLENQVLKTKAEVDSSIVKEFIRSLKTEKFSITFSKCNFSKGHLINLSQIDPNLIGDFVFERCKLDTLRVENTKGSIEFYNTQIEVLAIEKSNIYKLRYDNSNPLQAKLAYCAINSITFSNNFNNENAHHLISSSNIKNVNFNFRDAYGQFTYRFDNDTISNIQFYNGKTDEPSNYTCDSASNIIIFNKCHLINPMVFKSRALHTKIKLIDCTFGPGFNLADIRADYLVLDNSPNIPTPLIISFATDSIKGQISLINTDVTNLKISWKDKAEIYFDSLSTPEVRHSTFNKLLDKYTAERQPTSYKVVDLRYRAFTQSVLRNKLESYWWGHGYKKNRAFIWSCFFLLFFIITNIIFWEKMQKTYELFNSVSDSSGTTPTYLRLILPSILYSSFIFFSLTIRLDKLKLTETKFVIWFMIQYLLGLFCLIFIIKAILRW